MKDLEKMITEIIEHHDLDIKNVDDVVDIFKWVSSELDFHIFEANDNYDYWIQVNYYSKYLGHTIVVDCDFQYNVNCVGDVVFYIENIQTQIDDINKKLGIDDLNR